MQTKHMVRLGAGAIAAGILLFGAWMIDCDRPVSPDRIPPAAKEFLATHYPDSRPALVKKEFEHLRITYKVILTDATKLEFRNNGQWKKVESKHGIVPVGIIPPPIQAYIDENFPVCGVSELKHGRRSYEVELNNGIDLTFDDSDFFLTDYDD